MTAPPQSSHSRLQSRWSVPTRSPPNPSNQQPNTTTPPATTPQQWGRIRAVPLTLPSPTTIQRPGFTSALSHLHNTHRHTAQVSQQQQHPTTSPLQTSPTTIFTSHPDPSNKPFPQTLTQLDDALSRMDIDAITNKYDHQKVIHMLETLYQNTITIPIQTFHNIVTQRDELLRIKSVITTSTFEASAKKATDIITRELPAERPVLAGLIREETEQNTSGLKRKLQSALDQLERTKKTLKTLTTKRLVQSNTEEPLKNLRSSNMTWSRSFPVEHNGNSTVAAATLPTSQHLPAHPRDIHTSVLTLNTTPQLPHQLQHPAQLNTPHAQHPTPRRRTPRDNAFRMAVNNAAAARRRKLKKRHSQNKF
jgi:hypothetical protein